MTQPTKRELVDTLSQSSKKLKQLTAALKEAKAEIEELKAGKTTAEEAAVSQEQARRLGESDHAIAMTEIRDMFRQILVTLANNGKP